MNVMKQMLVITISLFLNVGMVCARVCDIGCDAQAGIGSPAIYTPGQSGQSGGNHPKEQTNRSGHCHQGAGATSREQSEPDHKPKPNDRSSACRIHFTSAAVIPTDASAIAMMQQSLAPAIEQPPFFFNSFDQPTNAFVSEKSFRGPPGLAFFSILRI